MTIMEVKSAFYEADAVMKYRDPVGKAVAEGVGEGATAVLDSPEASRYTGRNIRKLSSKLSN